MKSAIRLLVLFSLLLSSAMPIHARSDENRQFLNILFKGKDYPVALTQSTTYPWRADYNSVKTTCHQNDVGSNCWFALDMYVPEDSASITFDYQVRYYKEEGYGWSASAKYAFLTCSIDGKEVFRNNGTDKTETETIKISKGHHTLKWNLRLTEAWENWDYFSKIENMRIEGVSDNTPLPEFSREESKQWCFPSESIADTIEIENIGVEDYVIAGIERISAPFHIETPVNKIPHGGSGSLIISFEPSEEGSFEQTLVLLSDKGKKTITLQGMCYETTPVCVTSPGKLSEIANNTNAESLTIFGPINREDNYHLANFKKLKYLDLRGTDMERVFNGGVNNLYELEDILFPSSLKYIDTTWFWKHYVGRYEPDAYYAINSITCLSPEPPKLIREYSDEELSFDGLRDDVVVYVPAPYLSYYSSDEKWNKFKLMPLSDDSRLIKVTMDEKRLKDYEGCSLVLEDNVLGRNQNLTLGDAKDYFFHNIKPGRNYSLKLLHRTKRVLANIDNITVGDNKSVEISFDSIVPLYTAILKVKDNAGNDVTKSIKAEWHIPGQSYVLSDRMSGLIEGDSISCQIKLPKDLGYMYNIPEVISHIVDCNDNIIDATLVPISKHNLQGRIFGEGARPLSGATITLTQSLGDNLPWTKVYKTDEKGLFDIPTYQGNLTLEIACDKYFTKTLTDSIVEDIDLGDITLSQCNGRRLKLDVDFQDNAPEDKTGYISKGYDDWKNLVISVLNADNGEEINIKTEYPNVYFSEALTESPNMIVKCSHRNHKFDELTVPCSGSGDGNFTAEIHIVEHGDIKVVKSDNRDLKAKAMLYDSDNKLVKSCNFVNRHLSFKCVPDGKYHVVAIEDNGLYDNLPDYSLFATLGLKKDKDFAYSLVEIKSGTVEVIDFPNIPELAAGFSIAGATTAMSPAKSSVAAGNYLTVKALVDIKNEYIGSVKNVTLNILIPESVEFVPNSLLIGSQLASYVLNEGRVEIPLSDINETIRFCVLPQKGGDMNLNAYLSYEIDGAAYNESIGGFAVEVTGANLNAVRAVANREVKVSGSGPADADVEIFDDNVLAGKAKVLANGRWQTAISLCDDRDLKTHHLHAVFHTTDGQVLYSDSKSVKVNGMRPYVKKVEMINGTPCQYVTTFDFSNPYDVKPSYSYNSGYPDFTFKVWFENVADQQSISDALLWVKTSDGKNVPVQLVASPAQPNLMIGSAQFPSSYSLPTNVAVALNYIDESVLQPENALDILSEAMPTADALNITRGENDAVSYELVSNQGVFSLLCAVMECKNGDVMSTKIDEIVSRFGFEQLMGDACFYISPAGGTMRKERIDDSNIRVSFMYDAGSRDEFQSVMSFLDKNFLQKTPARVQVDDHNRIVPNSSAYALSHRIDQNMQDIIDLCNKKLDCVEKFGEVDVTYAADDLKQTLNNMTGLNLAMVATMISGTHEIVMNAPRGDSALENAMNADDLDDSITNTLDAVEGITDSMRKVINNLNRYPTECGISSTPDYEGSPVTPLIDPSGYVYEAVPGNRLEGVKATAYHTTSTTDEEDISIWDAEMYEQENPLYTDREGRYAWDVPAGMWKVVYEKAGYETAESDWLPVPPPQMDVNIGMVQLVNPAVSFAKAYPDSIVVGFTKYMDVNTLTDQNIRVEKDDNLLDGSLAPAVEESCDGRKYARQVSFIPALSLTQGDLVSLSVSSKAKSYAGCALSNDYSALLQVEKPINPAIPEYLEVALGETSLLNIQSIPADLSGRRVNIAVNGDAFISLPQSEMIIDGDELSLEITGLLPGKAFVTISIDGHGVCGTTEVTVLNNLMKQIYSPWATVESGSTVKKGSIVYLYCATPDVQIYYTTDDSCPCDPMSRLLYSPEDGIVVDRDMRIKAYAVADGMWDSEIIELSYKVDSNQDSLMLGAKDNEKPEITPTYLTPENDAVAVRFAGEAEADYDIFDIRGDRIARGKVKSGDTISFAKYIKGAYILSLDVNGLRMSEKIVKSF